MRFFDRIDEIRRLRHVEKLAHESAQWTVMTGLQIPVSDSAPHVRGTQGFYFAQWTSMRSRKI